MNQLSFFNQSSTIAPSTRATDGNQQSRSQSYGERWQKRALDFLRGWAMVQDRFSTEVLRAASKGLVRHPPSFRAWEAVLREAARQGWVKQIGPNLWQSNHRLV